MPNDTFWQILFLTLCHIYPALSIFLVTQPTCFQECSLSDQLFHCCSHSILVFCLFLIFLLEQCEGSSCLRYPCCCWGWILSTLVFLWVDLTNWQVGFSCYFLNSFINSTVLVSTIYPENVSILTSIHILCDS